MEKNTEIIELESLIFGFWQYGEEQYYFGHMPDDAPEGMVEIESKNNKGKMAYNILKVDQGFELHIGNYNYRLSTLNEREMTLIGPDPAGVILYFKKIPNKITYAM